MKDYKIDFVIAWVDGSDPEWQKEKRKYSAEPGTDSSEIRYRDMDILKYWFRAVENYAPWVNKVHFITWGHLPAWLNTEYDKLNIVKHTDYIPEKYLPTFSSRPIELNLHRIEGLSEHFVYFNDDMMLNRPVKKEHFFKNGLPCDFIHIKNLYDSNTRDVCVHTTANEVWTTNNHFSYIKSFLRHPFKYVNFKYPIKNIIQNIIKLENVNVFPGFTNHHMATAYLKSMFEECWKADEELLDFASSNKFRTPYDVSQSIFRYRQLALGKFHTVSKISRGKFIGLSDNNEVLVNEIINPRYNMLCINDSPGIVDFEKAKREIVDAYEKKLPQKSCFES